MSQSPGDPGSESGAVGRRILAGIVAVGLVAMGVAVGIVISGQPGSARPVAPPASAGTQAAAWQNFTPPGGAFGVDFPGSPTPGQQTLATGAGTATATSYSAFHGLSLFALSYADVVGLTGIDQVDPSALTSGLLSGDIATLTDTAPISGYGYAGRQIRATAPGLVLTEQFIVASQRLYVAVVSAPADAPAAAEDVDHFFTSFHVDVAAIPSAAPSAAASGGPSAAPSGSQPPIDPNATPTSTPIATPQPTPPVPVPHLPAGWQSWYSPVWHVVLGYPPGWQGAARDRFDSFASSDGSVVILVDSALNDPARSLDQIAADDADAIRAQSGWEYRETKHDLFGSLPAVWIRYHLISSSGTPYEGVDVYALSGNVVLESTWIGSAQPSTSQLAVFRQFLATITLTP